MDFSQVDDAELGDLSPFDLDWGIELPKQTEAAPGNEYDTPHINEDDYSEEEVAIFKVLKKTVRDACNVNTPWPKRQKALEWCFVRGEKNRHGFDFHTGCMALGARPEVVLARLHHQLYVAGVPLREPLPLWIDLIPEQYVSEAIMAAWDDGVAVVREVWQWPGIPLEMLEKRSGVSDTFATMEKLEKAGLLAWRFGCVFLSGRSVDASKKRAFSWSKSFF